MAAPYNDNLRDRDAGIPIEVVYLPGDPHNWPPTWHRGRDGYDGNWACVHGQCCHDDCSVPGGIA